MREHLATLLDDFRRFGRGVAVVRMVGNRRRATTYAELARLAGRFAALLAGRGIGPGDRVLLWAENSAEWIGAFYGCMLRGVLVVPLDAYGSAEFAARVAADVRPRLVVGDALLIRRLRALNPTLSAQDRGTDGAPTSEASESSVPRSENRDLGHPHTGWPELAFEDWATALPAEEAGPVAGLSRETQLQILFTSGTTGEPKGIVHTHGNVLASVGPIEQGAQPYLRYERLVHPLRFLHTLPLSHVFGQTMGLWVPPIFAAEVHFESQLVAPRLMETIRRERISVLAAVPRVMALLKTHLETSLPGLAERVAASQGWSAWQRWWRFRDVHRAFGLKFWALVSGGGALSGPLEQFWNALGFVVVQGYGMTETTALITLNHPFHVARGTLGKPLAGREVKLGPDGEVLVRGPMISGATWQGGELRQREDEWLATGDLAEAQATGELRFLGRKSETIVTAAGVNIHPEDVEAALEQEPEVAACAVVAVETAGGPEPFAVLALRGAETQASAVLERANARLAEFQRVRRWALWPEPDLPRTSTGKVRRKVVAEWVAQTEAAKRAGGAEYVATSQDWLTALIAEITEEAPAGTGDALRLAEDLHLDSLGRVQLAAAIEARLGSAPENGLLEGAQTLGDLRKLVSGEALERTAAPAEELRTAEALEERPGLEPRARERTERSEQPPVRAEMEAGTAAEPAQAKHIYPHWPWWKPVAWVRMAFQECVARPLVWLMAHPKVELAEGLVIDEPMLIICNHVTTMDGPLVEYALPGPVRRWIAAAMSGEMLDDYRHFRNTNWEPGARRFQPLGPVAYVLLTALYNVFPLPRRRQFQRSFQHAGEALDRGYHVLVFPEGTRSATGELAQFRQGIGLLTKQSRTAVLPVAIAGLGALKRGEKHWFRARTITIRVGRPVRFAPEESEAAITARLHDEVERLLKG
ncbi:MAG: AMP-binding protein [Acidobacteriota bacterium]|nr:AMP-binding protein [Acidobacteriota bacterium]